MQNWLFHYVRNIDFLGIFSTLNMGRGLSIISYPSLPITLKICRGITWHFTQFNSAEHFGFISLSKNRLFILIDFIPVFSTKWRRVLRFMVFPAAILCWIFFRILSYLRVMCYRYWILVFLLFMLRFPAREMLGLSSVDNSVVFWEWLANTKSFKSFYLSSLKGGSRSSDTEI